MDGLGKRGSWREQPLPIPTVLRYQAGVADSGTRCAVRSGCSSSTSHAARLAQLYKHTAHPLRLAGLWPVHILDVEIIRVILEQLRVVPVI